MNTLSPEQRQSLHDALCDAFDLGGLTELVRYNLTHRLDVLVNTSASLDQIVFNLLEALDKRGELEPLLRGAIRARPNNEQLATVCRAVAPEALAPVDTANLVRQVTAGIGALAEARDAPAVAGGVAEFRVIFRGVASQTKYLAGYKSLHDGLHNLQLRMGSIEAAASMFTAQAVMAKLLSREVINLREHARRADSQAAELPNRVREKAWIDDLDQVASEIDQSLQSKNETRMGRAVAFLRGLLQETYRIDGQMATAAADLPLGDLIGALDQIVGQLGGAGAAGGVAAAAPRVRVARDALVVIRPQLDGLIAEHSTWQGLNKDLAGVESNPGSRPDEKVFGWAKVKRGLLALCDAFRAAPWSQDLVANIGRWEQAADAGHAEQSEESAAQVYATAMNRFFNVDQDLLHLCGQLTEIGVPIDALLGSPARATA